MYAVASPNPDPDPYPRGGGELPNPNECHSMLTSAITPIPISIYIYCLGIEHDFKYSPSNTSYYRVCPVLKLKTRPEYNCSFQPEDRTDWTLWLLTQALNTSS